MNGVEFPASAGFHDAALGDDAQARVLDPGVDLAGQVAPGCVRLDDREGAFNGHNFPCVLK